MTIVNYFCVPGGHSVAVESDDPLRCPPGWVKQEAECVHAPTEPNGRWSPGIWYAKTGTGYPVLCCPEHPLIDPTK